jgi:dienelactone hydrolase
MRSISPPHSLNREVNMKLKSLSIVAAFILGVGCSIAQAQVNANFSRERVDYSRAGPCRTETQTGTWRDTRRDREVPYLMRLPLNCGAGPSPIVIMSHGLGGSREGLGRLSERLASSGYIVVHPQHLGSDSSVWGGARPQLSTLDRGALSTKMANPRVTIDRFLDIPFVLGQLRAANASGPLRGRFDMQRTAMAGHSFGAVTTQAMAGQKFPNGAAMPDMGFKAYIAMSPSAARGSDDGEAFARMRGPILYLTGSEDNFTVSSQPMNPNERRKPYEQMPANQPAALVTLIGGDHWVFSGREITGQPRPNDTRLQAIIDATSVAFLDANLKQDRQARMWLAPANFTAFAGSDARLETKGWR